MTLARFGGVPPDVQALWQRRRPDIVSRVDALTAAVGALSSAGASRDAGGQRDAQREAHRLAGTLGTFGFTDAPDIARRLEQELDPAAPLGPERATRAAELVRALRVELDRAPVTVDVTEPASDPERPALLIVDTDPDPEAAPIAGTVQAAGAAGLRTEITADLAAAERILAERPPDGAVFAPAALAGEPAVLDLVERCERRSPPVPTVLLTRDATGDDRLRAARSGSRATLPRDVDGATAVGLIESIIERQRLRRDTLLVVDDDPVFLALAETLLSTHRMSVATLEDSRWFWQALEDVRPDLVLLDLDLPHISGVELCKAVREDPQWAGLPVLVLTPSNEAAAVQQAFAMGADDYVVKPVVGPELMVRITNRLERVQLYHDLANKDPLTDLANRRQFSAELTRLRRIADRYDQPLAFVMIDLDQFKDVNDRHGHVTGDDVLHGTARWLGNAFRGEDLVARWGGEEFALALFGMGRDDGVQRVDEARARLGRQPFIGADGTVFHVTFSAGVAEFPLDGTEVHALYQAADEALLRAKWAGGDRVLGAGSTVPTP